jgi:hypothetical protein
MRDVLKRTCAVGLVDARNLKAISHSYAPCGKAELDHQSIFDSNFERYELLARARLREVRVRNLEAARPASRGGFIRFRVIPLLLRTDSTEWRKDRLRSERPVENYDHGWDNLKNTHWNSMGRLAMVGHAKALKI